ncbi:hypothetical protein N5915_00755 [Arcobacter lacus]|uniref:hypothetical protein n=1 Tax=Arcobacter lacus TaxID=1912876 RepID=UPI0021BB868E|nr:hypothetical protein [Arcobacter lacus]MCT7908078.1 hypothetical protein [Arcobacter lacus]
MIFLNPASIISKTAVTAKKFASGSLSLERMIKRARSVARVNSPFNINIVPIVKINNSTFADKT